MPNGSSPWLHCCRVGGSDVEEHPLAPPVEQLPRTADTSEFLASWCVFGDPIALIYWLHWLDWRDRQQKIEVNDKLMITILRLV